MLKAKIYVSLSVQFCILKIHVQNIHVPHHGARRGWMKFPLSKFFFIYTSEIPDIILTSMLLCMFTPFIKLYTRKFYVMLADWLQRRINKVHVPRHVTPMHSSCSAYFINPTNFLCFCFHCQWHYCFTL